MKTRATLLATSLVLTAGAGYASAAPKPKPKPKPVLRPGPTILGPGDEGPAVRKLQARLRQIAWFFGDVTDVYGDQTAEAVRGFQGR